MKPIRRFFNWVSVTFRKQGVLGKILFILAGFFILCLLCSVPVMIFSPSTNSAQNETVAVAGDLAGEMQDESTVSSPEIEQSTPIQPTNTEQPTQTPEPTKTPRPTNTPPPPTATPDPNVVKPGTYLVGTDIRPGLYRGETSGFDIFSSCYWERLKDLSGNLSSIIANDNSIGQYYIEVSESDFALRTHCELEWVSN